MSQKRHYSFSQLKLHKTCPRQYWHRYFGGEKAALPHALFNDGQASEDALMHLIEHDMGRVHEQHPRLAGILEQFFPDGSRAPLTIDFPAYQVLCHTDYHYVESTSGYLIDFKLAQVPQDDLQLRIYALAMHKAYGVTSVRSWYYITERAFYTSHYYDVNDFAAIEQELVALCDAIHEKGTGQEAFPIRPALHCELCPYAKACEAADAFEIQAVDSEEQATLAYGRMKRAETVAAQLKDELAAYMERQALNELKVASGGRLKWSLAKPSLKEYKK